MRVAFNKHLLLLLAIAFATAVAYWPGLSGSFVFDDFPNIVHNAEVHISTPLSFKQLHDAAFSTPPPALQRPLANLSFALNWLATGSDARPMKTTNLAIHLLNGLLLYWMLCQLFRTAATMREGAKADRASDHGRALIISAGWLLLPINLTAVLYVVQRMESLCQTFVLIGLWLYFRGRESMLSAADSKSEARGLAQAGFGIVSGTAIGLLAKESAVLLPLYAFLAEASLLHFRGTRGSDRRLWLLFLFCLFIPAAAGAAWLMPKVLDPAAWSFRAFSLPERLLTESRVLIDYLRWTLLPNPHVLSLNHDDIVVSHGLFTPAVTAVSICGLAGLLTVAVLARQRMPLFTLGIFWFLAAHLLTATFVPLELAFEHRNYFASIGVLMAALVLLEHAASSIRMPSAKWVVISALCLQFAVVTRLRAEQWAVPVEQSLGEARDHPQSVRANYQAAQTLVRLSSYQPSAMLDAAIAFAEHAASLPGSSILPEQALIIINNRAYHRDAAPAWQSLIRKLQMQAPSSESIDALIALNDCFAREYCRYGRESLQQAYEVAAERTPARAPFLHAYAGFARDVLHDDKKAAAIAAALSTNTTRN